MKWSPRERTLPGKIFQDAQEVPGRHTLVPRFRTAGREGFSESTNLKPSRLLSLAISVSRSLGTCRASTVQTPPAITSWQNEEASWAVENINNNWELRRIQIWYNFKSDLRMPPPHIIQSQLWNLGHPYIIPPNQATSLPCNPLKGLCPYPSHLQQAI